MLQRLYVGGDSYLHVSTKFVRKAGETDKYNKSDVLRSRGYMPALLQVGPKYLSEFRRSLTEYESAGLDLLRWRANEELYISLPLVLFCSCPA